MVGFFAALPAIFSAISGAAELFDTGKQVYEEVTGKTAPDTETGLQAAVEALPDDQKQAFAERMTKEIEMYRAQNERLEIQGGRVDAETLAALPAEAAAEVAIMRMTTRPWVVRQLTRAMVWPVMSVFAVDILLAVINTVSAGFWAVFGTAPVPVQFDLVAGKFFGDTGGVYVQMYSQIVEYSAYIVITYMTLREAGKAGGPKQVVAGAVGKIASGIKAVFSGSRK
ncbi:MAG: hypothetical protein ACMZ66_05295 [Thalassospira sp.]|uniref:hypothetical protein n=1 Tax=Thalassospira sp. TaxID=1912094 RepID=UPI003A8AA31D